MKKNNELFEEFKDFPLGLKIIAGGGVFITACILGGCIFKGGAYLVKGYREFYRAFKE